MCSLQVLSAIEQDEQLARCLDDQGRTPLLLTCLNDRFCIVRLLRAFEVDFNVSDKDGVTPLHAACMNSTNLEMLKVLVRQGALINSGTLLGRTILHGAAQARIGINKFVRTKMRPKNFCFKKWV